MGLTLNTNSLTIPSTGGSSAASGLSTSDVTTLIKSNTPYQFIKKVDASGAISMDFSNVFTENDGFTTYRIILDHIDTSSNLSHMYMRLEISGTMSSGTGYGWSNIRHDGSSSGFNYDNGSSYWYIYNYAREQTFFGHVELTGTNSGLRPKAVWNVASGESTRQAGFTFGSGNSNLTSECTGFQIRTPTGSFNQGSVKLYGVNHV